MWGKLALLVAGGAIGYLGKKIYDENQTSAPKSQDVVIDYRAEDKRDNQEAVVIPEPAVIPEPVIITESAAAAALKHIYENNGPGDLDWDVSVDGQVLVKDGRVEANEGTLISLNLQYSALHGVLKLHDVESLVILKAGNCNLDGIDFKNLSSLKELSLRKNFIVDITSLSDLKSLSELDLCENAISGLRPLSGLTNLRELNVCHNEVIDLSPLFGLTNLTKLDIGDNMIRDFSPLGELKTLVAEDSFTNQRKETLAALEAVKKEPYARKFGKCPNCKRVIRDSDIKAWKLRWFFVSLLELLRNPLLPAAEKSGKCPDCGQLITLQSMGSSLYHWQIVTGHRD